MSLSTSALLELLAKWSGDLPRCLGMVHKQHREAAFDLLKALLLCLCKDMGGLKVPIDIDASWKVIWPRPLGHWKMEVLVVGVDGMVDLASWVKAVTERHPTSRMTWWHTSALSQLLAETDSLFLWDIFRATCVKKRFRGLHEQLVWRLGQLMESLFSELASEKRKKQSVSFAHDSFADIFEQAHTMDRKLAEYVLAGRCIAQNLSLRAFSVATDKASVGGLGAGLQNSIFTLGASGIAVLAVPQARIV